MVVARFNRLEQGGAQRGREGQRHKRRERDRGDHDRRELAVNIARSAREKRQRHKHRHQHHGHANDGPRDLAHRLTRGLQRRQTLFAHDAFDVLDHHNGIVHHDADHQHHAKHGQHVDGKTQRQEHAKGAQQGNWHHQGGDDGVTPVLQKQKHHQKHQSGRFQQGVDDFGDGDIDKGGAVVGHGGLYAGGEEFFQLFELGVDIFGRLQGVAIGCELHAHAHPGCAVQPGRGGIGLAAQLDAGHVFEAHRRTIGVGPQGDVAKLLHRAELAIDHHGSGNALPGEVGQIANGTAGHLGVLGADGGIDIGWGQGKAG